MKAVPDSSVDLILCDLPYGTTQCAWDTVIDFHRLWVQYERIAKPNCPIVLTACQPFTSALVMSNPSQFKYDWVYEKGNATGFYNAKIAPLRAHESILVFCNGTEKYYPQKTTGHVRKTAGKKPINSEVYGKTVTKSHYDSTERYPRSVQKFQSDKQKKDRINPTQKPLMLMEYLVRTYSADGDIVMDNCFGGGTTGVACANLGRRFIGFENNLIQYAKGSARIITAYENNLKLT
jgi:site-specific DNA-methyltransferase (adenine-specific)